jgi:serine/threonine-protein kinase
MSTVYKAKAPITGRIVALKILRPRDEIFVDLVGEARLREIFIEEARIMGGITHAHVARIIDCDAHEGIPFIVLEYFSHSIGEFIGEAYKVELESRVVSVPKTYLYMSQALKGLERLHFSGIVHRDIKPYNLMITNDDRVKIIDFGLSRVRGEEKMAIPGMQVGSPYYAAPEQEAHPKQADGRADLYSIGVLMYRMLTGRLADPRQEAVVPPSELNQNLNGDWDAFLLKALAVNPSERFEGAVEMRVALEQVYLEWKFASEQRCSLRAKASEGREQTTLAPRREPRSEPARIMYKDIRWRLELDELFRPKDFFRHQLHVFNPLLLHDPVTGLYWQRIGTGFTLDWQQAWEYIAYLNDVRFQGRATWRLPTTEELATVLRSPTVQRDFCIDPNFEPSIHWLWSADHCTKKTAWMADIMESHIGRLDKDGTASVCAVSC